MVPLYSSEQVHMALSPSEYCILNGSEMKKKYYSKWVSDCCLTPSEQYFSYNMARTSYIRWDDVRFALDQQTQLAFYSASSHKQQPASRHVIPLGHIILIPSQPVFALTP